MFSVLRCPVVFRFFWFWSRIWSSNWWSLILFSESGKGDVTKRSDLEDSGTGGSLMRGSRNALWKQGISSLVFWLCCLVCCFVLWRRCWKVTWRPLEVPHCGIGMWDSNQRMVEGQKHVPQSAHMESATINIVVFNINRTRRNEDGDSVRRRIVGSFILIKLINPKLTEAQTDWTDPKTLPAKLPHHTSSTPFNQCHPQGSVEHHPSAKWAF